MELYASLKSVWQGKARENRLAGLKQKAIEKGYRPSDRPTAKAKTVKANTTGNKVTKNQIFCMAIQNNPGITMAETCDYTGSHDKHYNLLKVLMGNGQVHYGQAKNGGRAQGLYWINQTKKA